MQMKILAEATALFVQVGYDGISMREIAAACQMTKAGLYYYYQDKATLLLAILSKNLDEVEAVVSGCLAQAGSVQVQIRALVGGLFSLPVEQRAVIRIASSEMRHLDPQIQKEFNQEYHLKFIGPIQALLTAGITSGEFEPMDTALVTWMLLGMMYPFFTPTRKITTAEQETITAQVLQILFSGLVRKPLPAAEAQ